MLDIKEPPTSALIYSNQSNEVSYEAICYPPGTPAGDWSLKHLRTPEDVRTHPAEATRLGRVLASHGIKRAYAPHVAASSALVVSRSSLTDVLELPYWVQLFRNARLPAAGTDLDPGDAFIMSGGGCPVVIAIGENLCIVAHASRDSLLDRVHIMTGKKSRKYAGVLNAIVGFAARKKNTPLRPQEMDLHWHLTIPACRFAHRLDNPKFGHANRMLEQYVVRHWGQEIIPGPDYFLSVSKLIHAQGTAACFKNLVGGEDIPEDGPFGYTGHPREDMRQVRSLNIVHRKT